MTMLPPVPDDRLSVWNLSDPEHPIRVGETRLVANNRGLSFSYDPSWVANGYPLSGDMPLQDKSLILPKHQDIGLGAINDAMPDRWGEKAIRYLDRPKRVTPLDLLYFAGDRRFGSLGFSISSDHYKPHDSGPLPELDSIEALMDLIQRIDHNEPLTKQEKMIASSTRTMGGAHPKALVNVAGKECIAKFPRGSNVDIALIEHASMVLAAGAGITVCPTHPVRATSGHVVVIERFDRHNGQRLHCLSSKTILLCGADPAIPPIGELSYPAMADFIRQAADPRQQSEIRKEIFRRMVFNILIENTDDHEKNHAFIFNGHNWSLAPAYDVLPLMSNAGFQEMIVGDDGAEGSLANALSQCERFDLDHDEAIEEWFVVADRVSQWKTVFADVGVTASDIEYLSDFIDSPDRVEMRSPGIIDSLPTQHKRR
jgi:serine/threonine-protein kinase HipA